MRGHVSITQDIGLRLQIFPRASFTSYLSALNSLKRERATSFTDSTANGRIL
jgi:hypothetical protein